MLRKLSIFCKYSNWRGWLSTRRAALRLEMRSGMQSERSRQSPLHSARINKRSQRAALLQEKPIGCTQKGALFHSRVERPQRAALRLKIRGERTRPGALPLARQVARQQPWAEQVQTVDRLRAALKRATRARAAPILCQAAAQSSPLQYLIRKQARSAGTAYEYHTVGSTGGRAVGMLCRVGRVKGASSIPASGFPEKPAAGARVGANREVACWCDCGDEASGPCTSARESRASERARY